MIADVTHISSSKNGVADGMNENVCIGMAEQSVCVLQLDSAEPEVASFNKFVDIVAEANSYLHVVVYFLYVAYLLRLPSRSPMPSMSKANEKRSV